MLVKTYCAAVNGLEAVSYTHLDVYKRQDFSMPFSASYMIAFADDSTIPTHDNGSHHRIGFGIQ